jgi:hypothetical protein
MRGQVSCLFGTIILMGAIGFSYCLPPSHAVQWLVAASWVSGSQGFVNTNEMSRRLRLLCLKVEKKAKAMYAI